MLKIIFCGSRHWTNRDLITFVMRYIYDNIGEFTVIEGEQYGADKIAGSVAEHEFKLPVEREEAEWTKYGKAAGPIRNAKMLKDHQADATVAFHHRLYDSLGTKNMVYQTRSVKKPVWVSEEGPEALANFILDLKRILREKQS